MADTKNMIEPMDHCFVAEIPGGKGRALQRMTFRTYAAAWAWVSASVKDAEDISGAGPKVRKSLYTDK